eukprot:Phypoly_transcript_06737.p1 GENE.Phypoly_transcript_06737~~Phypoly_transcript_06737.p1  ORF type:complete len:566 (+),score=80.24 Phypoly_transcript_06737:186-1700(+)
MKLNRFVEALTDFCCDMFGWKHLPQTVDAFLAINDTVKPLKYVSKMAKLFSSAFPMDKLPNFQEQLERIKKMPKQTASITFAVTPPSVARYNWNTGDHLQSSFEPSFHTRGENNENDEEHTEFHTHLAFGKRFLVHTLSCFNIVIFPLPATHYFPPKLLATEVNFVRCMAVHESPSKNEFATGGDYDYTVRIMRVSSTEIKEVQKFTHVRSVTCLQFDDDKIVASAGGIIKIWDRKTEGLKNTIYTCPNVRSFQYLGNELVVIGVDALVRMFDMETGFHTRSYWYEIPQERRNYEDKERYVCVKMNEKYVVAAISSKPKSKICIWEKYTGHVVKLFDTPAPATRMDLSENFLLCGCEGSIYIYEVATGNKVKEIADMETSEYFGVSLLEEENHARVVTAGNKGKLLFLKFPSIMEKTNMKSQKEKVEEGNHKDKVESQKANEEKDRQKESVENKAHAKRKCANPACTTGAKAKKKCSVCLTAYYCCQECQKQHWKEHKKECKKM